MLNKFFFNSILRKPKFFILPSTFSSSSYPVKLFSNIIDENKQRLTIIPGLQSFRNLYTSKLFLSDEPTKSEEKTPTEGEKKLVDMLRKRFPKAKTIEVIDISGGCGSMYAIYVETIEFKNIRTVKQHQLINDVLKSEIKNNMHGLRIQTAVPES